MHNSIYYRTNANVNFLLTFYEQTVNTLCYRTCSTKLCARSYRTNICSIEQMFEVFHVKHCGICATTCRTMFHVKQIRTYVRVWDLRALGGRASHLQATAKGPAPRRKAYWFLFSFSYLLLYFLFICYLIPYDLSSLCFVLF